MQVQLGLVSPVSTAGMSRMTTPGSRSSSIASATLVPQRFGGGSLKKPRPSQATTNGTASSAPRHSVTFKAAADEQDEQDQQRRLVVEQANEAYPPNGSENERVVDVHGEVVFTDCRDP